VEGIVALLLAEDPLTVRGVLVRVLLVLAVELRESDGEGEQNQQEQSQELPKLLQHLAHGDLQRNQEAVTSGPAPNLTGLQAPPR